MNHELVSLQQKERKVGDEAPAVRVKMLNNETKVIGMMADKVQAIITLNNSNLLDEDLQNIIDTHSKKALFYIISSQEFKNCHDKTMCSYDFLNISKKLGVCIDETTCTNSLFIINKEGEFTYIQIPSSLESDFDLDIFEEALIATINFKQKGHTHENWMGT